MKIAIFVIGLLVGFTGHKGLNYAYDYSFNKAFDSEACHDIMIKGGNLSDRFACTYKEMGYTNYIGYALMRPNASNDGFDKSKWIF